MSNRTDSLFEELQGVFGGGFGVPLDEDDLDEARKGAHQGAQRAHSKKAFGKKSNKGKVPLRHQARRTHDVRSAKKISKGAEKAAAKDKKGQAAKAAAAKKFEKEMADIRGEVSKSKKKSDAKKAAKMKKHDADSKGAQSPGGGDSRQEKQQKNVGKKTAKRHFPFKRSANLGPGPEGKHHDETKCWKCKCGNVYREGCRCVSTGQGAKCPPKGTSKKISFQPGYKRAYNRKYHAWRAQQGGRVTQRLGATRTAL